MCFVIFGEDTKQIVSTWEFRSKFYHGGHVSGEPQKSIDKKGKVFKVEGAV